MRLASLSESRRRRRHVGVGASRRPPFLLVAIASLTVALLSVPPIYLIVRASNSGAWSIMNRPATWHTVGRTLLLVVCVGACSLIIGATMAWLVARTDLPGARVWGVLSVAPLAMPSFVAALALAGATGPQGLLSKLTDAAGLGTIRPLHGLLGATIALTMATFPYVYLLSMASLRTLDPALEDAARSLGRGRAATFMAVTLPHLRRALTGGALLAGLYAISDFGAVSLMRYDTVTRAIFGRIESGVDRRPAAALGLILIVLTAVFLFAEIVARGRSHLRSGPGLRRAPTPVPLGRWKIPALAFAGLVGFSFVIGPVTVMAYWVQRAAANGTLGEVEWGATVTSVLLALVSAVVVTIVAVPVAVLARRYPRTWTRAMERTGYGANALPGVVVGLSLVFLAARYLPAVYLTFPLLIAAYLIRFFAQALSGVDTALAAVNPRTEEAARSLGRNPLQVLREVTLPLMRPGLFAAAMLVFLSVIKELPVTTLLIPTGSRTLATEVWRKTTIGAYGAAAVPALVLILVAIPFILVAVREHTLDAPAESPATTLT